MAKSRKENDDGCITIKKYANRRLYNTSSSSYITLDYLAKLIKEGRDFKVIDAKSGDDITHNILTQIIMEEESGGQQMLPVGFLRELIAMYGNSMQSMIPQYLEASMEAFRQNQEKFRSAVTGGISANPFAQIARQNLAMFEAASSAFGGKKADQNGGSDAAAASDKSSESDIDELKAQMAAMQKKLDELAGK